MSEDVPIRCPACQKQLNALTTDFVNCPHCERALYIKPILIGEAGGTATVPNRPMDYIKNPKKEKDDG